MKNQIEVRSEINGDVEFFKTMEGAMEWIASELAWWNIGEKQNPYTMEEDFIIINN